MDDTYVRTLTCMSAHPSTALAMVKVNHFKGREDTFIYFLASLLVEGGGSTAIVPVWQVLIIKLTEKAFDA